MCINYQLWCVGGVWVGVVADCFQRLPKWLVRVVILDGRLPKSAQKILNGDDSHFERYGGRISKNNSHRLPILFFVRTF